MSMDWVYDMDAMYGHFGVNRAVDRMDAETRKKFLEFRVEHLQEEVDELREGLDNPEEVVDAIIDLCVFAIGTLVAYRVDANKAWDEVLRCNMKKMVGMKKGRPNPYGLPDLMKPEGWEGPDHTGNHGLIGK